MKIVSVLLLAGLGLCGRAAAETYTMTTYYPSPAGVYTDLTVTSGTVLARDVGNVGIGVAKPLAKLEVAGGIRPGAATKGAACAPNPEGAFAYDMAAHAPVFCNSVGVWAGMGGGTSLQQAAANRAAKGVISASKSFNDSIGDGCPLSGVSATVYTNFDNQGIRYTRVTVASNPNYNCDSGWVSGDAVCQSDYQPPEPNLFHWRAVAVAASIGPWGLNGTALTVYAECTGFSLPGRVNHMASALYGSPQYDAMIVSQ